MRDMSIYEERDGLLAKVERLRGVLDMYTAANTEALKAIAGLYAEAEDDRAAYGFLEVEVAEQIAKVTERDEIIENWRAAHHRLWVECDNAITSLRERNATIERVRVMAESWAGFGDKNGFRSTMVFAAKELRSALDVVPADKLTIIDTKGESRHA